MNSLFFKLIESLPKLARPQVELWAAHITTPLGDLIAISDDEKLYQLDFLDRLGLQEEVENLCLSLKAEMKAEESAPLALIKQEFTDYFNGGLTAFQSRCFLRGTPFQVKVWETLMQVPFGSTCSYSALAAAIGKPTAYRAVAQANACNRFAVIVPCHRVINANGNLGGYDWGLERKRWLLAHEKAKRLSAKRDQDALLLDFVLNAYKF